jgi:hypothetical protein
MMTLEEAKSRLVAMSRNFEGKITHHFRVVEEFSAHSYPGELNHHYTVTYRGFSMCDENLDKMMAACEAFYEVTP